MPLFSGTGSQGYEAGAQVNYGPFYVKAQTLAGEIPVTQGLELRYDRLSMKYGWGSIVQHGEYNDTWGDTFAEAAVKYTFDNGMYLQASTVSGTNAISLGLSAKWGE